MPRLGSSISFTVTRCEPELVKPEIPIPNELKQLSDIDNNNRFPLPVVFFYKNNPSMVGQDPVRVIREALGRALVYYYPLAGRLIEGSNMKLFVDCNCEGVSFIEASANITLDQLGDKILSPDQYLREILYYVPGSDNIIGSPIVCVQVTRLLCGGFILAVRLHHAMCDGIGLAEFLQAVAEIARGAVAPSILPSWQRDLLNAREQPRITRSDEGEAVSSVTNVTDTILQRSFIISPDFMKRIRRDVPHESTSYEVLTAFLWKCVALALNLDHEEPVYVVLAVSARNKKYKVNIPVGYYGNAFGCPHATSKSKRLCEKPLAYAVELVKAAKGMMSFDYFHSMIDSNMAVERSLVGKNGFLIVSDVRFFGEIDYGWDLPVYASPVMKHSGSCHLSKYRNISGSESSIVAMLSLPEPVMYRFEHELKKIDTNMK